MNNHNHNHNHNHHHGSGDKNNSHDCCSGHQDNHSVATPSKGGKIVYTCPMHPEVKQDKEGMCPECGMQLVPEEVKTKIVYTCPMHPEVKQDKEGMCPECGMQLVPEEVSIDAEHDKHKGHSTNIFKVKFWVSFILSIPIVIYSDITQQLLDFTPPQFPGSQFLPLVLASIIFFYGGWLFIASAVRELRAKMPGMMTLIALAISVAYVYSIYVVISGSGRDLFWELATLITVMLLGHWLEMRAVKGAQGALQELSKLLPDKAEVERDGKVVEISISELREGDIVIVKPGGRVPADGVVVSGESEVDESIVTGESKPVMKQTNDKVIAGTINGDGLLKVKVDKIGDDTFLAHVMKLVAEAQASKSKLQLLSDKAAFFLTVVAVVVGGVTFAAWLAAGDFAFAIERTVAVLVIACPHALGLAIPLVASISTTMAARNGFLVKQRLALEAARNIDIVLFDKTGTLTKGEFGIADILTMSDYDKNTVIQLAASVNSYSEHPLAKAMVKYAKENNIDLVEVTDFQRIPGKGARAFWQNKEIVVGSPTLLKEKGLSLPDGLSQSVSKLLDQGKTVVYVFVGNDLIGAIALADVIRPESKEAIDALHAMGIKTAMITGDDEPVARWVAGELNLDEYFARVLPEDKVNKVKELQNRGLKVAMVGDGVNDAPALMQADLGIAIGAGTNVAIESAGIILVKNDPRDIVRIIRLSNLTYKKMIQNLWWAAGYNIVAIPLAAGILAKQGILLQPAAAAILMSLSTVIVAANAVLLKRKKL